jgi:hypothetical protein
MAARWADLRDTTPDMTHDHEGGKLNFHDSPERFIRLYKKIYIFSQIQNIFFEINVHSEIVKW